MATAAAAAAVAVAVVVVVVVVVAIAVIYLISMILTIAIDSLRSIHRLVLLMEEHRVLCDVYK